MSKRKRSGAARDGQSNAESTVPIAKKRRHAYDGPVLRTDVSKAGKCETMRYGTEWYGANVHFYGPVIIMSIADRVLAKADKDEELMLTVPAPWTCLVSTEWIEDGARGLRHARLFFPADAPGTQQPRFSIQHVWQETASHGTLQ
jgi:hypothetical protein